MNDHNAKRPIIIKRVVAHEDDHGGHWKVAYADFMTAMMAFFLVMWLLSSVTDKQRRGVAQYFSATQIIDLRPGNGVMDGNRSALQGSPSSHLSPISQNSSDDMVDDDAEDAHRLAPQDTENRGDYAHSDERLENQRFNAIQAELDQMQRQTGMKDLAQNIAVSMTPDGLRIQIFDRDDNAMFNNGSAEPNKRLMAIMDALIPVLAGVQNPMVLSGYTDDQPLTRSGYGNWELSSDRANATRRYMEGHGIDGHRFMRVEGLAATDPLLPEAPSDPRNRRIALTLLRANAVAQVRAAQANEKAP